MANQSRCRCRTVRSAPSQAASATPALPAATQEPPVRRWPHPVNGPEPALPPEPTLHYIHCALSYQNQLLADIKALLEQLAQQENSPDL